MVSLRLIASAIFIAYTAFQTYDDRRRSKAAGIDYHVGKPASRDDIMGLLAQADSS